MAADTEVVRITYTELEERASANEEKEIQPKKATAKEGFTSFFLTNFWVVISPDSILLRVKTKLKKCVSLVK